MVTIKDKIENLIDTAYYWIRYRLPNGNSSRWIMVLYLGGKLSDWGGIEYTKESLTSLEEAENPDKRLSFLKSFTSWL